MKTRLFLFISFLLLFLSCKDVRVKKPAKLIEREKMIDILYDISILEAINAINPAALDNNNIDSRTYIFSKHKIDSLQFAENSAYYASDLKNYKKIYEEVENRIIERKKLNDSLLKIQQEEENKREIELRTLSKDSLKAKSGKKQIIPSKKQK